VERGGCDHKFDLFEDSFVIGYPALSELGIAETG
jgi:hypothetical protein